MQVLEAEYVMVAEVPQHSNDSTSSGGLVPSFISGCKSYHLHLHKVKSLSETSFAKPDELTHYADHPLQALFSGVFLEEASMRTYLGMYQGSGSAYSQESVAQHQRLLAAKVVACFQEGVGRTPYSIGKPRVVHSMSHSKQACIVQCS